MFYKEELLHPFLALYELEESAYEQYSEYIEQLHDKEIIDVIKSIRDDEERHMIIAEKLIELVR